MNSYIPRTVVRFFTKWTPPSQTRFSFGGGIDWQSESSSAGSFCRTQSLRSCGARPWRRSYASSLRSWHHAIFSVPTRVAKSKCWRSANGGRVCGGRWVADPIDASVEAALADLAKWLDETRIPAVIVGAVAASILGRPDMLEEFDKLVARRHK